MTYVPIVFTSTVPEGVAANEVEQLSVAVAPGSTYAECRRTYIGFEPLSVMTGAVTSITVTIWLAVAVWPLVSVTVQVTVVCPSGNEDGALLVAVGTPQCAPMTGLPSETLAFGTEQETGSALTVTFAGAVIVGGVLSTILSCCVTLAVFDPSVTVEVTVYVAPAV